MNLFPFDKVRNTQKKFMEDIAHSLSEGNNVIAHAPTGIGKTAGVLSSVLPLALKNKMTIFFLTPKHTQHKIIIETLKKIKEKHNVSIKVSDFIGKQWFCLVPGAKGLYSGDFSKFCSDMKADEKCIFYNNLKKISAHDLVSKINKTPHHSGEVKKLCNHEKICPYEILVRSGKNSDVIIGDYYHLFNKGVRKSILAKTGKKLENSIVIVDEAHNLPNRIKSLMSYVLTENMIKSAIKEARTFDQLLFADKLEKLLEISLDFEKGERLVSKEEFIDFIESNISNYSDFQEEMAFVENKVRIEQKRSFVGSISKFFDIWLNGDNEGFVRYVNKDKYFKLFYKCLDPSVVSKEVFSKVYSSVLMSGTLTPTKMYSKLLEIKADEYSYPYPFPKENRLALIHPNTTTKYSERNNESFKTIGAYCSNLISSCPGNFAVFFPSYDMLSRVEQNIFTDKDVFIENRTMKKDERLTLFNKFTSSGKAVLLGVIGGSFSEGMDYPGKFLEGVAIVGIPFERPDLETKERIKYYDKKLNAGWTYGYLFPAMNRVIQAAGRVIRSESDKGVIVFMDKRYLWKNYLDCMPSDLNVKVSQQPWKEIKDFFDSNGK